MGKGVDKKKQGEVITIEHAKCLKELRDRKCEVDSEARVCMATNSEKCAGCSWRRRVCYNLERLPGGGGRRAKYQRWDRYEEVWIKERTMFMKMKKVGRENLELPIYLRP